MRPTIHQAGRLLCWCGTVHRPAVERSRAHDLRPFDALFQSNTLKNLKLEALDESSATGAKFGGLHTAYSNTGANEATGGGYARAALVWSAASVGVKALAATLPSWSVAAGTYYFWSGWDASTVGNFLFMMALNGGSYLPAMMEVAGDLTSNAVFSKAHGYVVDTRVVFWPVSGITLPSPLAVGTVYYVGTVPTADSFTVSTTAANANPVDITGTAPYGFMVQSMVPEVFGVAGTLSLASGSVDEQGLL